MVADCASIKVNNMDSIIVPDEIILSKILFIRNQKLMIDRDLAELYCVTTGILINL